MFHIHGRLSGALGWSILSACGRQKVLDTIDALSQTPEYPSLSSKRTSLVVRTCSPHPLWYGSLVMCITDPVSPCK